MRFDSKGLTSWMSFRLIHAKEQIASTRSAISRSTADMESNSGITAL